MNEAEAYSNYIGEGPFDDPPSPDEIDEAEDIDRDDDEDDDAEVDDWIEGGAPPTVDELDFEGIKADLENADD